MGEVVAEYTSKSRPGRVYHVQIGADGITYCDCWQWKINRTCKHIKDWEANGSTAHLENGIMKNDQKEEADEVREAINDIIAQTKGNV